MLPEGTKTCRLCGHVLWRDEEKVVCVDCQRTWHVIAQAYLEILPNTACSGLAVPSPKLASLAQPANR